jgi:hypothetical protein
MLFDGDGKRHTKLRKGDILFFNLKCHYALIQRPRKDRPTVDLVLGCGDNKRTMFCTRTEAISVALLVADTHGFATKIRKPNEHTLSVEFI